MNELLLMFIPFRRGLAWKFSINEFYYKDVEDVRRQVDLCFTSAVSVDPLTILLPLCIISKTPDMSCFIAKR